MPRWDGFIVPILKVMARSDTLNRRELSPLIADEAGLDEDLRSELLSSGQFKFENRIGWGISFLTRINALERPTRGYYRIAEGGRYLLNKYPNQADEKTIKALLEAGSPEVLSAGLVPYTASVTHGVSTAQPDSIDSAESSNLDPIEQIQNGVDRIHEDVAAELLRRLHQNDPAFFEQAVVDLVVAMGYAGSDGVAARTQLTNDHGIDGVVDQDALGLNRVYIQAKRYALDSTVQRPDIQAFVGALHGVQADRGLFITTAKYSSGAKQYADSVNTRVILIDGARLANLMIRYSVGVQTSRTVRIVKLDEDYFE